MAGASSSLSGATRYTRVVLTIGELCTRVERRLLEKYLTDKGISLEQHLNNDRSNILRTYSGKTNRNLYFPAGNVPPNIEDWDLSAICFIITDFSSIPQLYKDDIGTLRHIRNKICHCASTQFDETIYLRYKQDIDKTVDNALGYINDLGFRQEMDELATNISRGCFEDNVTQHVTMFQKWIKIERGMEQRLDQLQSGQDAMMNLLVGIANRVGYTAITTVQMANISNQQEDDLSQRVTNIFTASIRSLQVAIPDKDLKQAAKIFLMQLSREGIQLEETRSGCVRMQLRGTNQDLFKLLVTCVSGQMTEWLRPLAEAVRKMPGYEEYDNHVVIHRMDYVDYMVQGILKKLRTLHFAYRWTISVHGHELDIYKTDERDKELPKELIDTVKTLFTEQELCVQFHSTPLVKPVPVRTSRRRYEQSLSHKESSSHTEFTVGQMKPSTVSTSSPEFAVGQMKPSTESTSSLEYGIEKISLRADKSTSTSEYVGQTKPSTESTSSPGIFGAMAGVSSLCGTTRYTRVVLTVGEVCTRVERRLLDKFLTDHNIQLAQHLANNRSAIQRTNNGRINHAMFFPSNNLPNLVNWDISAICFIITDFSSIPQRYKDDIVNLRDVRRKIFHCAFTEIDERNYLEYQGVLKSVVDNALGYINDEDFRLEIEEMYADIKRGRFKDNVAQHLNIFRKWDKIERGMAQELHQIRSDMAVMMKYLAGLGQHVGHTESGTTTPQMSIMSNRQEDDLSRRFINIFTANIRKHNVAIPDEEIEQAAQACWERLLQEGFPLTTTPLLESTSTSAGNPIEQANTIAEGDRFSLELLNDATRLHSLPVPLPTLPILSMSGKLIVADPFRHVLYMHEPCSGRTLAELELPSKVGDMDRVSADLIAVTLPNERIVQFLSVPENKLAFAHSFRVHGESQRIACTEDLVFVGQDRFVDVFTLKGEHVNTIAVGHYRTGTSFSATNEAFYISELSDSRFRHYHHDGERLGEFYDPTIRAMPLVVSNDGHLLSMDEPPGVLRVFTGDMKLLDAFELDHIGLCYPASMCYNETESVIHVIDSYHKMFSFKLVQK